MGRFPIKKLSCFVRGNGTGTSGNTRGGMRSRLAAHEDEDAEGDAQLQEEVVERERRKSAYGKRRMKTTRRIS
jgi:hypothetical protein